jgi:hypothetical protein
MNPFRKHDSKVTSPRQNKSGGDSFQVLHGRPNLAEYAAQERLPTLSGTVVVVLRSEEEVQAFP